jgi:hypothetical protein
MVVMRRQSRLLKDPGRVFRPGSNHRDLQLFIAYQLVPIAPAALHKFMQYQAQAKWPAALIRHSRIHQAG